jgi:hypothetical protein
MTADTRDTATRVADTLTGRRIGKIWWIADTLAEATAWQTKYLAAGALAVRFEPQTKSSLIDVVISMYRDTADEVLGYHLDECEWLEE